ncbi:MAG: tripartite tricarboxylate transporter TctB family protein [Alkalispirochaeta sp.]
MSSDAKKELGLGLFFLVLSIAYMIGTTTISTFTPFDDQGLDSRSVPLLIGFLTFILSVIHIVGLTVRERKAKRDASYDPEKTPSADDELCDPDEVACMDKPEGTVMSRIENVVPVKLVLSMLFLVIYVASFRRIGFILASTFFLMAESFLLVNREERKKWKIFIVLYSIGAAVLIYFVFTEYLSLFLPRGILG